MAFDKLSNDSFLLKIVSSTVHDANNFVCELRCNINNEKSFLEWLKSFSEVTKTNWIVRRTSCKGRYEFSRDYECQHSSYHKNSKKDVAVQKNKNCQASLKIRIKRNNKNTRYRDPYVKEDLCGILKINYQHSHSLNVAEAWNWLKRKDETRQIFIGYFNNGFSPAEAIHYHEDLLLADGAETLADASINPPKRWVYYLHDIWRQNEDSGANIDESFFEFPSRPEVCKKWILDIRREKCQPNKFSSTCSDHFLPSDYEEPFPGTKRRNLKNDAVPSKFDFPEHLMKPVKKRRILVHNLLESEKEEVCAASKVEEPVYEMVTEKKIKQEPVDDVGMEDRIVLTKYAEPQKENEEQNLNSMEKIVLVPQTIIENSVQESFQNQVNDLPSHLDRKENDIPSKRKRSFDDALEKHPLTDQISVLQRIDSLSKHIETTSCALSILSKAVNNVSGSSVQIVSVVNNLSKSINSIESTLEQFLERKDE